MTLQSETHHGNGKHKPLKGLIIAGPRDSELNLRQVIEPDELVGLLERMLDEGYALTIGRTKDGGAISWGFLMGGPAVKKYTASRGEWLALLASLE